MPRRIPLLVVWLIVAWCVLVVTHEAGHILLGWCTGATLLRCDLAPWRLPYSLFGPDPVPLATLWGGPVLGVVVPVAAALILKRDALWFIASFCMLANGAYLALAWFTGEHLLDAARLLEHGAPPWMLAVYCAATIGPGYFGFRRACGRLILADGSARPGASGPATGEAPD